MPVAGGAALWSLQPLRSGRPPIKRPILATLSAAMLAATIALAVWSAFAPSSSSLRWGPHLTLTMGADDLSRIVSVLVAVIALPIVAWAAVHEAEEGLLRLVSLLVAFVGAMQLLALSRDLLTLFVGWELVSFFSWALIAHRWRESDVPAAAAHAFNATRAGGVGLLVAAGAVFTQTGSLQISRLSELEGAWLHAAAAGIIAAAAAKSAQLPFAPWLYSAMAGPTSVSALLHAATMVAAGAYLLARVLPLLEPAGWVGPALMAIGLATALVGGAAASFQTHIKKLLAASTSAHYGLMLVAIGAGFSQTAVAHLVSHAAFKALLFLVAGAAIAAVGSEQLSRMRLGGTLPVVAAVGLVGALATAGVPPLGGAWTKERAVAAAAHASLWAGALGIVAGGLSALYSSRFYFLVFGRGGTSRPRLRPRRVEVASLGLLAAISLGLGALWLPIVQREASDLVPGTWPSPAVWETVASLVAVAAGLAAGAWFASLAGSSIPFTERVADWFGLPAVVDRWLVTPFVSLCTRLSVIDDRVVDAGARGIAGMGLAASGFLARSDRRVVDAGVRGVAAAAQWLARVFSRFGELGFDGLVEGTARAVGAAATRVRAVAPAAAHRSYLVVGAGILVLIAVSAVWR